MRLSSFLRILSLSWVGVLVALTQPVAIHAQGSGIPISAPGHQCASPVIAISANGIVHMAWEQEDGIWYRRLQNGVLSPLEKISSEGENPTLAVDPYGEIAYLAWEQAFDGNYEIFTRKWDARQGWLAPHNVSDNAGGSTSPTLAISNLGVLHLIWSDTTPGVRTLYHAISTNGESWPVATPIPEARGSHPSAAIDAQGVLRVAWQDRASFSENFRIWTAYQENGAWHTPVALTDGSAQAFSPQLASQGDMTLLVWQEGAQSVLAALQDDAWKRIRIQSGASPALAILESGTLAWAWETEQELTREHYRAYAWVSTTWGAFQPRHPDLFAHGGQIGIVWAENRTTGQQIFYSYDMPATIYQPVLIHH